MAKISLKFTHWISRVILLLFIPFYSLTAFSQNVGISPDKSTPNSSAGLDVNYSDKGVLIPRVSLTGTGSSTPLTSHVAGMMVYNNATVNDVKPGFYYNNGSKWIRIVANYSPGDMLYWDGSIWKKLSIGSTGQCLQLNGSKIPVWVNMTF